MDLPLRILRWLKFDKENQARIETFLTVPNLNPSTLGSSLNLSFQKKLSPASPAECMAKMGSVVYAASPEPKDAQSLLSPL